MGEGDRLTQTEYVERFEKIVKGLIDLTRSKNADYASAGDAFQNFRLIETLGSGVSLEQGIVVRMSDKFQRIVNLLKKKAVVSDESIQDTLHDLAVCSIILWIYLGESSERIK